MKLVFTIFAIFLAASCHAGEASSSVELRAIKDTDQQDRAGPPKTLDMAAMASRDRARREQVRGLLIAGNVKTAEDFFNAALVFQHGETNDDIRTAYALATVARTLQPDHPGPKWLQSAAWDRLLMQLGRPQWYGTQYQLNQGTGKFELYQTDETAVSDVERRNLGLPTLDEARKNAEHFN